MEELTFGNLSLQRQISINQGKFTVIYNQLSKFPEPVSNAWQEFSQDGKLATISTENWDLEILGPIPLPRKLGDREIKLQCYLFRRKLELDSLKSLVLQAKEPEKLQQLLMRQLAVNSLLVYGDFQSSDTPLIRLHSNCTTGDIFASMRCDCGEQLEAAFSRIVQEGVGAVVYMAGHEGRGIGLWGKGAAYLLQDRGLDTYCANRKLDFPDDSRDFADAAIVLQHYLKPKAEIRLLTNNPQKHHALAKFGIKIREQVPLHPTINRHNQRYLLAKKKYGHKFDLAGN